MELHLISLFGEESIISCANTDSNAYVFGTLLPTHYRDIAVMMEEKDGSVMDRNIEDNYIASISDQIMTETVVALRGAFSVIKPLAPTDFDIDDERKLIEFKLLELANRVMRADDFISALENISSCYRRGCLRHNFFDHIAEIEFLIENMWHIKESFIEDMVSKYGKKDGEEIERDDKDTE